MGRYDALTSFLDSLSPGREQIVLSFAEVEDVVGALPASARNHRVWWSNDSKPEAVAWRAAGWHVASVNLTAERVTFARGTTGGTYAKHRGAVRGSSTTADGRRRVSHSGLDPADGESLASAFRKLVSFLHGAQLTQFVADLESELFGSDRDRAKNLVAAAQVDSELLAAALLVRGNIGRINDLIHATAISLALPRILEEGEQVTVRPSLAAGNDPSRPFDLETDRRRAEFKLGLWTGADAMRKRGVFKDLVHLAFDDGTGRRSQLYVVGQTSIKWLHSSQSTAQWGLTRGSEHTRQKFINQFGDLNVTIAEFTNGPGSGVELIDLADTLPEVRAALGVGVRPTHDS